MADYLAPFHKPHMPTAEFDELKRRYVAEHGYTLTIPGPEDVFHFGTETPLTPLETANWKAKNRNAFDPDRYEEIRYMKKRRKDAYLAMLGSPSPRIVMARAAIMTSIDDAQDALSVLGAVGTLGYYAVSPAIRNMIQGPIGWILTAGNALNFVNRLLVPEQRMLKMKKTTERVSRHGHKSSKAKLDLKTKVEATATKYAEALKKAGPNLRLQAQVLKARDWEMARLKRIQGQMAHLRSGGWRGKAIEALQVTDNVYGQGISLGALMNLPYDTAAAVVRGGAGQTIHIKKPDIDVGHWGRVARKLVRNWLAFEGIPEYYRKEEHHSPVAVFEYPGGMSTILPNEDISKLRLGLFLAQQTVHMTADLIDPLDMNLSISEIELKAPEPTNPLTLEVIEEEDDRPGDGCTWPATGEKWSNARDLIEESSTNITDNLNTYCSLNAHSVTGWAVGKHCVDAGFMALENLTGTGTIQVEHNPSYRAINSLQWLNFCTDQNIPAAAACKFAEWLQRCDDQNYTPKGREVIDFAKHRCGFSFVQHYFPAP